MHSEGDNQKQLIKIQKIRRWRRYGLLVFFTLFIIPMPIGMFLSEPNLSKYSSALGRIMLYSLLGLLFLFFSTFVARFIFTVQLKLVGVPMRGQIINVHTFGEYVGSSPVFRVTGKLGSGEFTQAEFTSSTPPVVGSVIWFLVDPNNHVRSIKMPDKKSVSSDF